MQKPLALSIAVCLAFTGCQVFEKSETWETVMHVRPGDTIREADPSSSYADKLHRVLLEQGVEHYVVTYQYHYYTHQYEEAVGTRTAVIYRDNVNPSYPWWLKDDRTETPLWLPNGDMDHQVSFYARRKAEVIEKKFYPAHGGSGKASVALAHPAPHHVVVVEKPQPVTHIAPAKTIHTPASKPVVISRPASVPSTPSATTHQAAVTKIQRPATVAAAKPKAPEMPTSPASVSPHLNSFWSPPAAIDPVAQASDPAPRDEHLEKLFHLRNGTNYDRTSAVDRRKMEQLKHHAESRDISSERGIRHGVDGPGDRPRVI